MRLRLAPSRLLIAALAGAALVALIALIAGVSVSRATTMGSVLLILIAAASTADYFYSRRSWMAAGVTMRRQLPAALALGVQRRVSLNFTTAGRHEWWARVYDHADATLTTAGQPATLTLRPGTETSIEYLVGPTRRGEVEFAPADFAVRSRLRFWELLERVGELESRRVYPDFAQVARYAWLAGDRRLAEIGIKTYRQRGEGTDFKQLAEYRIGDSIRHIDWKATLRSEKLVTRQFQNERDQCVMLLIDCGRRMRADDRQQGIGTSHFDQVLNAVMLMTYVALKQGDAVGAMTFGTPPGEERWFAPRKGAVTLNALMGELYSVQPSPTHSDYIAAAQALLRRQHKRSLIIVITNFRDEDTLELGQALRLLRSRHLVLTASLREQLVRELASLPIDAADSSIDVASANLYEQSRRDAFNRIAARDALMVDAEPQRLGVELVNRYQAVKKAGLI
ncbi:MAG: DUF58 domain-containing protein [Povalibacter sp.]